MTDPAMVSRMASLQVAAEKGNPLVELLQTPTKFKEWLASKNPEEVVGHSYDCYDNPTFFRKGSPVHIRRIGGEGNCGQDVSK